MKVLHVIPAVAPRYGGPSRAVFDMCRATSSPDVQLCVATTDADGPASLPVQKGELLNYEGTSTVFFRRHFNEPFGYSYPFARWLKAKVQDFDVVHIHAVFSHSCLAAARACRQSSVPYIVRPLGSLDPWSMAQKSVRKRLLWHVGVRRMLEGAAAIHYTTGEEKRLAESSLGLARGVVVPLGVELQHFEASDPDSPFERSELRDELYILVLSRLHPKKNLESLIQAFGSLATRAEFGNWRLIIAGDGETDYVARLKQLARGTNHEERVVFTGWLAGRERESALKSAALLALPSFQENFGLCVAEALARGVPVVVSRHVNLAIEIEDAGAGWITGVEASEWETTLMDAMSDAGERERRGKGAREFATSGLAWPQVAADLVALYRSVVSQRHAPYSAVPAVRLIQE